MKISPKLAVPVFIGIFLSACNTLYNSKAINIEIFVPAKAIFPEKFDTIAVRFNNINSDYNPKFAEYIENNNQLIDSTNTDSTAAEILGHQFAEFLIPHWIAVKRLYYRSGQIDLKKTDRLVAEEKWLEAAEIWRKHVNNPNKKIAAKCKFNMALACEMLGQLDAAVDWAVQSYHVFGQNNPVHEQNCMEYINILSQRKLDIKRIESQFNPGSVSLK